MEIDFLTPIVPDHEQHINFKNIILHKSKSFENSFNLIAEDFYDKDNDIVKKFQMQFNPAFWEIYLHGVLKYLGIETINEHTSPDFVLKNASIEAVVASNARNKKCEYDCNIIDMLNIDLHELNTESILRYSSVISKKYNLYLKKYSKKNFVAEKPFIIALGSYDQPSFYMEYDRAMIPVAYGLYVDEKNDYNGDIAYQFGECPVKHMKYLKNSNGSDVKLGIFTDDKMQWLSAIIFSCTATISKIRRFQFDEETLIIFEGQIIDENHNLYSIKSLNFDFPESLHDGLQVYHNPYAAQPLSNDFLNFPGITHYNYNIEKGYFERHINQRSLIMRRSNVIHIK